MAPPPPPELVVDVVSEILLRLPPDEPECLFRASLVCKPWLRAITDPAFLRRYRAFHGTPPLLGLIDAHQQTGGSWYFRLPTRAVPKFPLPWPDARRGLPMDCRHGRILIDMDEDQCPYFLACEPVSGRGERHRLPPPEIDMRDMTGNWTAAAVFCATSGCKHLDCYGGPFCVVLMAIEYVPRTILATAYSSETDAWSVPAALVGLYDQASGSGAVIGDEIYFMLASMTGMTKYDWRKNSLSVVNLNPPPKPSELQNNESTLMVMEDCSLGLAAIEHSNLYLWSTRVNSEGTAECVECRVIDLDTVMPMANPSHTAGAYVAGFAEGVGVIFVSTRVGLFMIELKSERVRKVQKPNLFIGVLPYMGFYTPDCGRLFR